MSFERISATTALAVLIVITTIVAAHAGEVTLAWTAPGADGSVGVASRYDLRYSSQLITTANFAQANAAPGVPTPATAGTLQTCTIGGLTPGVTYYFAIKTADGSGNWSAMSNVISGEPRETAGDIAGLAVSFSAPRPNPARQQSSFRCTLPAAAPVRVEVFDVMGRRVRLLTDRDYDAGIMDIPFDLRDDQGVRVGRGIYLVRAQLGGTTITRQLVVVR